MNNRSLSDFHHRLHRWYERHGRKDLPWRKTRDPYEIYVSEIMLQQTQVKTVLERYYHPFLKRFPNIEALASASEKSVLKAWQGLGYYNRAVNLHKAAKQLRVSGFGERVVDLMELPGVGRNTAHAIAAFAYHQPVAVLEANVKRVVARIFAIHKIPAKGLWEEAAQLLDCKNPFDYNQAMMDVGAMLCTPRAPKCAECPANNICRGKDTPEKYPTKSMKNAVPVRKKTIIVLQNKKGEYFAEPRKGKFLAGLYGFVEVDAPPAGGGIYLGAIRQQYSHFTLEADVYLQKSRAFGKNWYSLAALKKLPISAAEQKILKLL